MPNQDLYSKTFTIPDHVAKDVGRSGSLSYTNMKKIASELKGKKDKSTSDNKLLNWVEETLNVSRDAVDGVKRIKMETEVDGHKDSVTGKNNNFKQGTNKDKAKRPTAIGGIPDITTMTKPRNIYQNKMDYIKQEQNNSFDKMRYLMEFMNTDDVNKKCESSTSGTIKVCKYSDNTFLVTLFREKYTDSSKPGVMEPFLATKKVPLDKLDAEIMNYYANPPFSGPTPENVAKGEKVLKIVHDIIEKIK